MSRRRNACPPDDVIQATARLLLVHRITAGLSQEEAALIAGKLIGKPEGIACRTWLRAEKGSWLNGITPNTDGHEHAEALANISPKTLAAMALAVDIDPADMAPLRPEVAELMPAMMRARASRNPAIEVCPALAELNVRVRKLDRLRLDQAAPLILMVTTAIDRLLDEQEVIPQGRAHRMAS